MSNFKRWCYIRLGYRCAGAGAGEWAEGRVPAVGWILIVDSARSGLPPELEGAHGVVGAVGEPRELQRSVWVSSRQTANTEWTASVRVGDDEEAVYGTIACS